MAKILMRIPSKVIQYGYIEMEVDLPTDDPRLAADAYMMHVSEFQMGEMDFVKSKQEGVRAPISEPVDVATTPSDAVPVVPEEADDDVLDAAAEALAEGLGGVTVVEDSEAPWEKPEPQAQANPWDGEPQFEGFEWGS